MIGGHDDQQDTRRLVVALGFVLAATLPFVDKAFHIDDVYFLEVAQEIAAHPLHPFLGAVALEDIDYRVFAVTGRCPSTFESMSHPPFVPYVIASATWLAGGPREAWLHLVFCVFGLGAGAAVYSLCRRFTRHPLAATLLVVSSPIFLLSAQSVMTDMPAMALGYGALALQIAGLDRERRSKVIAAGFLAGLAIVTRYSAVASVALLPLYAVVRGRARQAAPILLGLSVVCGAWAVQNLVVHGELHVLASTRHYRLFYQGQSFGGVGLVMKTLGDLADLGGTAFLAAILWMLAGTWRRAVAFGTGAVATVAIFVVSPRSIERLDTYSPYEVGAVACCFAFGVVLVVEALWPEDHDPRESRSGDPASARDRRFLVLWLVSSLAVMLFLLPFGAARYLLPALPPLWLLLVRRVEALLADGLILRVSIALVVAQGLGLSAVLGLADRELAGRYRSVATALRESYPQRTLWYVGEWGFRYYMEREGGRYLTSLDDTPKVGDIIVRPLIAGMHQMSPSLQRRVVRLQDVKLQGRWPIRMMSFDAKAGYYSHHWGYLPWAVSRAPLEEIEIFEVRSPAPPTPPTPCASS